MDAVQAITAAVARGGSTPMAVRTLRNAYKAQQQQQQQEEEEQKEKVAVAGSGGSGRSHNPLSLSLSPLSSVLSRSWRAGQAEEDFEEERRQLFVDDDLGESYSSTSEYGAYATTVFGTTCM